ncbi:lipase/acylhydrolase [Paenibacillus sp. J2TS4]|nr:lipase/acylhydrolase [Paenibacillus sp. J2TS4]
MIAVLSTVLFLFGFVYAVKDILFPIAGEPVVNREDLSATNPLLSMNKIQIVALGDSLTKGQGDSTGEGYVGKVKSWLEKETSKDVFVWNYAVGGLRTDQLLDYINGSNSEISQSIKKANLVLITIGGNDLFQFGLSQSVDSDPDSLEIDFDNVTGQMPMAMEGLERILSQTAELNPEARIIYVGLYHPFLDYDRDGQGSLLLQEWNNHAISLSLRYPNLTVVPTYDLFETYLTKYLASDHFHPNDDGYQRIAERVIQVLN